MHNSHRCQISLLQTWSTDLQAAAGARAEQRLRFNSSMVILIDGSEARLWQLKKPDSCGPCYYMQKATLVEILDESIKYLY